MTRKIVLFGAALLLVAGTLNDPLLIEQWHLQPQRSVTVALIDSGINPNHPDLAANIVAGWDFVDDDDDPTDPCYGHGTATAGVLGAVRDNNLGVAGVADNVALMPLRVLGCGGTGTEQDIVDAIEYAAENGAQIIQAVILLSAAWGSPCWDQPGCFPALCQAIEDSNLLFVAPSGNEGIDLSGAFRYPMSCARPNQITVSAVDQAGDFFPGNTGPLVDVFAPGKDIWTTVDDVRKPWGGPGGYKAVDGSSFATPQVTGLAARLLWLRPTLDAITLRGLVLDHTDQDKILTAFTFEPVPVGPEPAPSPEDLFFFVEAEVSIDDCNDRQPIASKQAAPERGFVFLASHYIGCRLRMEWWPPGASAPLLLDGMTPLAIGQSYHVRAEHDGRELRLFLDGSHEAVVEVPMLRPNAQPLRQGAYLWDANAQYFLRGSLTDFAAHVP